MSAGRAYRLWVSTSGVALTPLVEVQFQGDLTLNLGKTVERTAVKNGAVTAHGNAGVEVTFEMIDRDPLPTGQQALWDAHDNETPLYAVVRGSTGNKQWAGVWKVVITEITAPTSGNRMVSVTLSEDGTITRGVAPA